MKKLKIVLMSASILMGQSLYAQLTNPAPYCAAGYDDAAGPWAMDVPHFVSNVTLGTLNNTTGDTQFAAPHYVYYNTVAAPNLVAGSSYTLSVSHDPDPSSLHFVAVYIDYNHNNSFDDTGERVLQQTMLDGTITNPSVETITIPASATGGITRMRVMVFEDDNYIATHTDATPCTADSTGSLDWGETEDYNVNIIAAISTPAPVAAFTASAVTGSLATVFHFTDESTYAPTSRTWTFSPATVAWQSGSSDTSADPAVKFTAAGTYTAKLSVANASGKDSLTKTNYITVTYATGISEINATNAPVIYPDPARNYISVDETYIGADLRITDTQGRLVLANKIMGGKMDIAALSPGIYFTRIIKEDQVYTQMLSVEK